MRSFFIWTDGQWKYTGGIRDWQVSRSMDLGPVVEYGSHHCQIDFDLKTNDIASLYMLLTEGKRIKFLLAFSDFGQTIEGEGLIHGYTFGASIHNKIVSAQCSLQLNQEPKINVLTEELRSQLVIPSPIKPTVTAKRAE